MLERGWTAPDWPEEFGGGGLDAKHTKVLREEMKALGCRVPLSGSGLWMLGPALLEFGTLEQQQQHLPKILRGEIRWCQGYSEPGAGSDLANLSCKAVQEGELLRINGTKIWTSGADQSDWIFCLVRTSDQGPKQSGITFLLIDMAQPGVTVKPIELISGDSEFCQTFFDDATAHIRNVIGGLNQGWAVAKRLLHYERALMSELSAVSAGPKLTPVDCALKFSAAGPEGTLDPVTRDRLARYQMDRMAMEHTRQQLFEASVSGVDTSNTQLILKICATELDQQRAELLLELMGMQGLGWEGEAFSEEELQLLRQWAYSKALTIAGGSSEVQLNVIARRALQLPTR
jgi:acyl-CoA dehydrogenase